LDAHLFLHALLQRRVAFVDLVELGLGGLLAFRFLPALRLRLLRVVPGVGFGNLELFRGNAVQDGLHGVRRRVLAVRPLLHYVRHVRRLLVQPTRFFGDLVHVQLESLHDADGRMLVRLLRRRGILVLLQEERGGSAILFWTDLVVVIVQRHHEVNLRLERLLQSTKDLLVHADLVEKLDRLGPQAQYLPAAALATLRDFLRGGLFVRRLLVGRGHGGFNLDRFLGNGAAHVVVDRDRGAHFENKRIAAARIERRRRFGGAMWMRRMMARRMIHDDGAADKRDY